MNIKSFISLTKKTVTDAFDTIKSSERLIEAFYNPLYRNAVYLMLDRGTGALLGFVFWIIAARFYPIEQVGVASALIAAIGLITSFSLLGLNVGLIRFLPTAEDKTAVVNSSLTIVGAGSIIIAIIFIAGLPVWSPALVSMTKNIKLTATFILFAAGTSLLSIQSQAFVATRLAKFSFIQQVLWHGLRLAALAPLVLLGASGIFSAHGLSAIVALIITNVVLLRKAFPKYFFRPTIKPKMINEMVRFSLGNYLADAIGSAPRYLLPLMVLNILSAEAAAYYRIGFGVAAILIMIPMAVITSLFAEASHHPERLRPTVIKAIKFLILILMPAIILIMLLGDRILLIYGQEYSQKAVMLLRYLALASIPFSINELFVVVSRIKLRLKPLIVMYTVLAILIIGTTYGLSTPFGLSGIGIGWLASQSIVAVVAGWMLLKWLKESKQVG